MSNQTLEQGWTPRKIISVLVAAAVALVTVLTAIGTFLTEHISMDWGASILAAAAFISAFLPRVQWVFALLGIGGK